MGIETGPLPFSVGIDRRVVVFTVVDHAADQLPVRFRAGLAGDRSVALDGLESERPLHTPGRAAQPVEAAGRRTGGVVTVPGGRRRTVRAQLQQPRVAAARASKIRCCGCRSTRVSAAISRRSCRRCIRRIIERVEAIPGVQLGDGRHVRHDDRLPIERRRLRDHGLSEPAGRADLASRRIASDRKYFSTLGMTIAAGRDFEARDIGTNVRFAVVNEAMVRKYFKGRDPIGQRFGYDKPDEIEIIGVVARRARQHRPRGGRADGVLPRDGPAGLRRVHARPRHRRCGTDWTGGAECAARDRAAAAGRSRHDDRDAGGEHAAAGATDRATDHSGRVPRAGARQPRPLRIDGLRGEAAHRGARRPLRARRAAPRACCGWCSANR